MDWIQALTIIGVFAAFFIYLMNRMDTKFDHMNEKFGYMDAKFDGKIDQLRNEMHAQGADLRKEMHAQGIELRNEMAELRSEMRDGFNALQQYILLGNIDKKLKDPPETNSAKKET